ncbi:hypothetical protein, partial [Paracoccus sp. (in: a-proteobacteria)]|uniref:phage tail tube protein n=1 Tax=Paracoccus sp. TaxID=267 RepID=UPI0026DEEB41
MFRETTKLVLGRGELFFERFADGQFTGDGERYIGNTPLFQITRAVQRLKQSTSHHGRVHEKLGMVISEEIKLGITTDNISWDNIADWLGSPVTQHVTGKNSAPFTEHLKVRQGRHYQLGKAIFPLGASRIQNVRGVCGDQPLRDNIDWHVDIEKGRIFIPVGSERIPNGATISITFVKKKDSILVADSRPNEVVGSLRYVSRNVIGANTDYFFPMVRLSPEGAYNQKADEWQQMRFIATAMKRRPTESLLYAVREGSEPEAITADVSLGEIDPGGGADNGGGGGGLTTKIEWIDLGDTLRRDFENIQSAIDRIALETAAATRNAVEADAAIRQARRDIDESLEEARKAFASDFSDVIEARGQAIIARDAAHAAAQLALDHRNSMAFQLDSAFVSANLAALRAETAAKTQEAAAEALSEAVRRAEELANGVSDGGEGSQVIEGYVRSAKSHADDASRSASDASVAFKRVTTAVARVLPDTFDGPYWTSTVNGSVEDVGGLNIRIKVNEDDGVLSVASDTKNTQFILARGLLKAQPGRVYRLTTEIMHEGSVAPQGTRAYLFPLNAAFERVTGTVWRSLVPQEADKYEVVSTVLPRTPETIPDDTAWYRLGMLVMGDRSESIGVRVKHLKIEDITPEANAAGYAEELSRTVNSVVTYSDKAGEHAASALKSKRDVISTVNDFGQKIDVISESIKEWDSVVDDLSQAATSIRRDREAIETESGKVETWSRDANTAKNTAEDFAGAAEKAFGSIAKAKDRTVKLTGNPDFAMDSEGWKTGFVLNRGEEEFATFGDDGDYGPRTMRLAHAKASEVHFSGALPVNKTYKYRITARFRRFGTNQPDVDVRIGLAGWNAEGEARVWHHEAIGRTLGNSSWVEVTSEIVGGDGIAAKLVSAYIHLPTEGSTVVFDRVMLENVTAEYHAIAASGFAATVSNEVSDFEEKLTAANSAATRAETARGTALTYSNQASTFKTDAESAAGTATDQARFAVTAKNDAADSARAAKTSEGNAAALVTAAGKHAAASESSALRAEAGPSLGPVLPGDFTAGLSAWTVRRAGNPTMVPLHNRLTLTTVGALPAAKWEPEIAGNALL